MSFRVSHPVQALVLFLALAFAMGGNAQELFPKPAELLPDVEFWVDVYTEVDTGSGYIHDADDVSVVYETLQLRGDYHADKKLIRLGLARYRKILKSLAGKPREELTAREREVLALWGAGVSPERLREAADSVRFQRGQSDRFREGMARSGQWNDYIDSVLSEKGLPRELGVLPHVESSFNPKAYSSAGAAGIWQFTRSTGRRYLNVDYVVDERMDPFAATVAAAQLLEHNYQLTGTWPLALTAYNHGASSMRRASRQLGTTDIAAIVRNYKGRSFGFASRNFYVSFLAALEVSSNAENYFAPINTVLPVQYAEVELPAYVPIDAFARAFSTDFDLLKQHNRALLDPIWRGKKHVPRGFTMRVPKSALPAEPEQLLARIPPEERFEEQTPDLFHTVVRGDTVSEIARRYGHSIRDIAAMNGLNRRYRIRVGQVLRLPADGAVVLADAGAVETVPVSAAEAVAASPAAVGRETAGDAAAANPAAEIEEAQVAAIEVSVEDKVFGPQSLTDGAGELLADPGDYTVADDGSIEVQASETLGHYAEWLDIRASQLRRLNSMRYGRPVVIGRRLKLDFQRVDQAEFERRRLAYHQELQQAFFMAWHIRTTNKHVVAQGDSLWELTRQQYKVPMWLLRQFNPDLDPDRLQLGMVIVIPELVKG
jgi:membrane-bound lytic murein transglycosylase D